MNEQIFKDTPKSYEQLLRFILSGEKNAISVNELADSCGICPRMAKAEIQKARLDGIIICSNECGYFYPKSIDDVASFYKRMHSSAITMLRVVKASRLELIKNGVDLKELLKNKKEVYEDEN